MTEARDCIHGLAAGTCVICGGTKDPTGTQADLNLGAIATAVADLGATKGTFRTKEVEAHPAVKATHAHLHTGVRLGQLIGTHLTNSWATLRIEQISENGVANATWRWTGADEIDAD
jgi:hypothetical protein